MSIRNEAVREAARRWPLHWDLDTHSRIGTAPRVAFVSGAEWARTHLAAQEPTDGEVWAVQKYLYDRTLTWVPTTEVRAALSAARAARRDEEKR